jgi:hypothetical protein
MADAEKERTPTIKERIIIIASIQEMILFMRKVLLI